MSKTEATDDVGFILEVNLKYPVHLHESHNDYPLDTEKIKFTHDMLSSYSQSLINKHSSTEKLAPNQNDNVKYDLNYETLRLYLELELNLLKFIEFFKSVSQLGSNHIDFNTTKRKEATSSFLQNLFKLFINSIYGKTMKCLRNRINLKLVTNPIRAKKLIARPTFQRFDIISKDLSSIIMTKDKVLLNRPIYLGFSTLDMSKITKYSSDYQQIVAKYGSKAKLAYTDTDSFVYLIERRISTTIWRLPLTLTKNSDYPKTHPLHSKENAKTLGKFKDECSSLQTHEFI